MLSLRAKVSDKLKSQHTVHRLCQQLNVAMSGYRAHSNGKSPSPRQMKDWRLLVYIKAAHARGRGIYGALKIQAELAAQGLLVGLNRIKRLRKLHGIRCIHKKKFRVTTDSKHCLSVAPNLLDRQFTPTAPNQVWVTDITYIPTDEGWLYLAAVKDLHTCEIVGYAIGERMTVGLCIAALQIALLRRRPKAGLILHSDRGSQYCAKVYQQLLSAAGIIASMSRRGNCYDNAPMESFLGSLKNELIHQKTYVTRQAAIDEIVEYIEIFYNRTRRHTSLGNISPAQALKQFKLKQEEFV